MGIKQVTTDKEISDFIGSNLELFRFRLIRKMAYVAEQVLNAARSTDSYKDQTGNLRSSLGYVIVEDGQILDLSDFKVVKNGQEGSRTGTEYIKSLASKYRKGIVLIVCAGMNYASYVEANFDVLDSAELLADRLVPEMLNELGLK